MLTTPDIPAVPGSDRPVVVRDAAGTWCYEGTDVPAVGARSIKLGEVVNPLVLGRPGEQPEAVILSLSEIVADARLNWVLQAGKRLEGDVDALFKVPWELWQEHASQPVGAWLPEHDDFGVNRALATSERRLRFAKKALDDAGRDRTRAILLATHVGKSRREVGETLGLSAARVQQLNEDPPADLVNRFDRFVRDASEIVAATGLDPCPRAELRAPSGLGSDGFDEVIAEMIALGLLEQTHDLVQVTDDGRSLAAVRGRTALPRTTRKPGPGSERTRDGAR